MTSPIPAAWRTTYSENRELGIPGQIYGERVFEGITSGWCATALRAGVGLVDGVAAEPGEYALPGAASTAAQFAGVVLHQHGKDDGDDLTAGQLYAANQDFPLYRKGWVIVRVGQVALVRNGPIYLVIDTAGGDVLGEFRGSADGTNTVRLDNTRPVRVHIAGAAAGVAVLELGMP